TLLLDGELGEIDPPHAHHIRACDPALDCGAEIHRFRTRRPELDDLLVHVEGFRRLALVDHWVHVLIEIVDARTRRDVHPEAPAEIRRIDHHRSAVDALAL